MCRAGVSSGFGVWAAVGLQPSSIIRLPTAGSTSPAAGQVNLHRHGNKGQRGGVYFLLIKGVFGACVARPQLPIMPFILQAGGCMLGGSAGRAGGNGR